MIKYCQPDYDGKIHPRRYIIVFEDSELGILYYDNKDEARSDWNKLIINWNCYLFGTLERENANH